MRHRLNMYGLQNDMTNESIVLYVLVVVAPMQV